MNKPQRKKELRDQIKTLREQGYTAYISTAAEGSFLRFRHCHRLKMIYILSPKLRSSGR